MNITKDQAKNGAIDIHALGHELAEIGASLSTSTAPGKDTVYTVDGANADAVLTVVAAHTGEPLPESTDKPARVIVRDGKALAITDDGDALEITTKAAVRVIR